MIIIFGSRMICSWNVGYFIPKRFKYKKKWAVNFKEKPLTQVALDHFDTFYKPVYGKLWPSIRIALLSLPKYCAVVNRSASSEAVDCLQNLGARNILDIARKTENISVNDHISDNAGGVTTECDRTMVENEANQEHVSDTTIPNARCKDNPFDLDPNTNLQDFMPVDKVYSEMEMQAQEIVLQNVFEPRDVNVNVVNCKEVIFPENLKAFAFPKGNITDFPRPTLDSGKLLGYYLMDAASILPVVALNIRPDDAVLDLCAAPGGKTFAILQTLLTENVTANDLSKSRMKRLRDILRWYCPERNVTIIQRNGLLVREPVFDKVLVDVPCNTDRHVLTEEDNNLFKSNRTTERLEMAQMQKNLLISGLLSCKPGGSVVYSTCTLLPAQNDGVIQAACEDIWQNTQLDIEVEDLSYFSQKFTKTFNFFDKCRYGQLVLPSLQANFGPMYFCKINRLN